MTQEHFTLYVDSRMTSPYALSSFVTLTEKAIPFEMKKVNLSARENHHADFASLSLSSRVPTLGHEGFYLSESSAICEYLEDLFPAPAHVRIYPEDLQQRARARQIQAWLRSDFMPIREERSTEGIFFKPIITPLSDAAQAAASKLFTAANDLLQDGALNLFDAWCIADTDLALMINRLALNGDPVPEKLLAYAQHQWQRASVQLWVQQERPV